MPLRQKFPKRMSFFPKPHGAAGVTITGALLLTLSGVTFSQFYSRVSFKGNALNSEHVFWIIYNPERAQERIRDSPTFATMLEAQRAERSLTEQLNRLRNEHDELALTVSHETARLYSLPVGTLLHDYPNETQELATVPEDRGAVIQHNGPHPALDAHDLAKALGISYAEAVRRKWQQSDTVVAAGESHASERAAAKESAIARIVSRFEADAIPKKFGTTRHALTHHIEAVEQSLQQSGTVITQTEIDAMNLLKGLAMTRVLNDGSAIIRRRPALLIFEEHKWRSN